jgi:hypothetical protein
MRLGGAASVAKGRRWPQRPTGIDVFMVRQQISPIPRRESYRCNRCRVVVEDRERGAHLQRCVPLAVVKRFTKVD